MGNKKNKKSNKYKANIDDTKQYKIKQGKNAKHSKETKKINKKKKSKLKKAIKIFIVIFILLILIGIGVFAGVFFSDKWAITQEDLIANGNTEVLDSEGKLLSVLSAEEGDGNRKEIKLEQMGKYTVNAYVAIEDKRFYEHSGVDLIRTAKATASYILHRGSGSDVGGASTITQQLVKNLMKDDADSGTEGIERKIREMSRAYQIEKMLTKNQIIEKYLNVIFVGGNDLHGIEYGAQYYFAKSAKDLDLAESAFLAGINNGPNMYDPYTDDEEDKELIKSRTKLVLYFMKDQNRISDNAEEAEKLYNEAIEKVDKGLKFKKGKIEIGNISYFVVEAVNEAAEDLASEKEISFTEAKSMIKSGGYKLYTTQVTSIQNTVIKEMAKDKYVETRTVTSKDKNGKSIKDTVRTNAGMTVIDYKTGKVVAMGGDLQQDQGLLYTNYATSTARQTGSSIKPLANLAPGLEEKIITASTIFNDRRTTFSGNYSPKNVGSYLGLCTVRKAIETSSNIVNIKMMSTIGISTCVNYLHEFGLDTYTKDDEVLSLAIGGVSHGSSTLQMAAAYACLANGGMYIEPTFYNKLVDNNGKIVVEPKQDTRRVISEANAFIIADVLTDVVTGYSGTASECAISGMDVAAKTGTTDDVDNKWLCGFTPYYAAATWYGYGAGAGSNWSVYKTNNAKNIWASVMKEVHKNLEKKRFTKPAGVVTAKVCKVSGKLATSRCSSTYTEYFSKGNVPKECDGHTSVKICKDSGKVATEYCLNTEYRYYSANPEMENNVNWSPSGKGQSAPTDKCTMHTAATSTITVPYVIGETEMQAKALLANLNVQVIYEKHEEQSNGLVLRQSLSEGTRVQRGVTIVITVNKVEESKPIQEETNTQNKTETTPGQNTIEIPSSNIEAGT